MGTATSCGDVPGRNHSSAVDPRRREGEAAAGQLRAVGEDPGQDRRRGDRDRHRPPARVAAEVGGDVHDPDPGPAQEGQAAAKPASAVTTAAFGIPRAARPHARRGARSGRSPTRTRTPSPRAIGGDRSSTASASGLHAGGRSVAANRASDAEPDQAEHARVPRTRQRAQQEARRRPAPRRHPARPAGPAGSSRSRPPAPAVRRVRRAARPPRMGRAVGPARLGDALRDDGGRDHDEDDRRSRPARRARAVTPPARPRPGVAIAQAAATALSSRPSGSASAPAPRAGAGRATRCSRTAGIRAATASSHVACSTAFSATSTASRSSSSGATTTSAATRAPSEQRQRAGASRPGSGSSDAPRARSTATAAAPRCRRGAPPRRALAELRPREQQAERDQQQVEGREAGRGRAG